MPKSSRKSNTSSQRNPSKCSPRLDNQRSNQPNIKVVKKKVKDTYELPEGFIPDTSLLTQLVLSDASLEHIAKVNENSTDLTLLAKLIKGDFTGPNAEQAKQTVQHQIFEALSISEGILETTPEKFAELDDKIKDMFLDVEEELEELEGEKQVDRVDDPVFEDVEEMDEPSDPTFEDDPSQNPNPSPIFSVLDLRGTLKNIMTGLTYLITEVNPRLEVIDNTASFMKDIAKLVCQLSSDVVTMSNSVKNIETMIATIKEEQAAINRRLEVRAITVPPSLPCKPLESKPKVKEDTSLLRNNVEKIIEHLIRLGYVEENDSSRVALVELFRSTHNDTILAGLRSLNFNIHACDAKYIAEARFDVEQSRHILNTLKARFDKPINEEEDPIIESAGTSTANPKYTGTKTKLFGKTGRR